MSVPSTRKPEKITKSHLTNRMLVLGSFLQGLPPENGGRKNRESPHSLSLLRRG